MLCSGSTLKLCVVTGGARDADSAQLASQWYGPVACVVCYWARLWSSHIADEKLVYTLHASWGYQSVSHIFCDVIYQATWKQCFNTLSSFYSTQLPLHKVLAVDIEHILLLACLMGQYCFAGWRLSSSSVTLPTCGLAGCWERGTLAWEHCWRLGWPGT